MSAEAHPAKGLSPLEIGRLVLVALLIPIFASDLAQLHESGLLNTAVAVAKLTEMVGTGILLWRPGAGMAVFIIPMALSLAFGQMRAEAYLSLFAPAALALTFRSFLSLWPIGVLIGYDIVLRQLHPSEAHWMVPYAVHLLGFLIGLGFRGLRSSQHRRQARIQILDTDLIESRQEERGRLSTELRSVIIGHLTDSTRILAEIPNQNDPEILRSIISRVNRSCTEALAQIRTLIGVLREDQPEPREERLADPPTTIVLAQLEEQSTHPGVFFRWESDTDPDALPKVDQRTITTAAHQMVRLAAEHNKQPVVVTGRATNRFGRVVLTFTLPGNTLVETSPDHDLSGLRSRVEALGGTMRATTQRQNSYLCLKLRRDPRLGRTKLNPTIKRYLLSPILWRLLLTSTLMIPAIVGVTIRDLEKLAAFDPVSVAGSVAWASAILLLWLPRVGAAMAVVAAALLLILPKPNLNALQLVALFGLWHLATRYRWKTILTMAVIISVTAGIRFWTVDGDAQIAPATIELSLLLLPVFMVINHFATVLKQHLEKTQRLQSELEKVGEEQRSLLASELHDIVAHHLSIISLQHMAYGDSTDPAELKLALDRITRATSSAYEEMETLMDVMSDPEHPSRESLAKPSAAARELSQRLLEHRFEVTSSIDPAADKLPEVVQRTIGRVMQEATTNILRYAAPETHCHYTLTVAASGISLEVTNQLPTTSHTSTLSTGYGLKGVAERVELLGGTFRAEPLGQVWVVKAFLPPIN